MSDTRRKDVNWNLGDTSKGVTWDQVNAALLMDIRDELKAMNQILHCGNFLDIPRKLDRIDANTRKPARKEKKP